MDSIFFSIVIPTMERHETLGYTIQTCLNQDYSYYEIIVSDNCSSAETKMVVDSFRSDKIRYVRSDERLAMTNNWEFAVSHARGDYVIVLGDDDALLRHALTEINKLIGKYKPLAVRWNRIYYSWPNIVPAQYAGRLHIPVNTDDTVVRLNANKIIDNVANYRMDYTFLPMLYNSAISSELIISLKDKTGRIFMSRSPDIYSGFAFAFLACEYIAVNVPMSINAGSAKSNGTASTLLGEDNDITASFVDLNTKSGIYIHKYLPDVIAMPVTIADSFLFAKDALFPNNSDLSIDLRELVLNIISSKANEGKVNTGKAIDAIRRHLRDDAELTRWFNGVVEKMDFSKLDSGPAAVPKFERGVYGNYLNILASDFGATDVFSVAELCDKIMGYSDRNYVWEHIAYNDLTYREKIRNILLRIYRLIFIGKE